MTIINVRINSETHEALKRWAAIWCSEEEVGIEVEAAIILELEIKRLERGCEEHRDLKLAKKTARLIPTGTPGCA